MDSITETLKKYFNLTCKKCGSDNVVLHYSAEHVYSDYTMDPASLTIGCNNCGENDHYLI